MPEEDDANPPARFLSRSLGAAPEAGPHGVARLDRPHDGRTMVWYYPDWRHRQVSLYRQAWSTARTVGRTWDIPSWETDNLVLDLFMFLATGKCVSPGWDDILDGVFQIHDHNSVHGIGARIKAYLVAGLIPEEIGDRMSMDHDVVRGYMACFFDVSRSLASRDRMATVVEAMAVQAAKKGDASAKREASLVSTAFLGGLEALEVCLKAGEGNGDASCDAVAERFVFGQMSAKAIEAAAYMRVAEPTPRKSHLDTFLEASDVRSRMLSAQAQAESVEDERRKNSSHRVMEEMMEFAAAFASESGTSDFAEPAPGRSAPSIDDLRAGRMDGPGKRGPDGGGIPDFVTRA